MVTDSRKNELYDAPEIDVFEVECEGVFCLSPGTGEDGNDGDGL